jgi:hypothetical protein
MDAVTFMQSIGGAGLVAADRELLARDFVHRCRSVAVSAGSPLRGRCF